MGVQSSRRWFLASAFKRHAGWRRTVGDAHVVATKNGALANAHYDFVIKTAGVSSPPVTQRTTAMTRRVLSAEIAHETNTFSILPATLESYRSRLYYEGADIARAMPIADMAVSTVP